MKIELSDETYYNIVAEELRDLHEHCVSPDYGLDNPEELQAAIRLVLENYMIPSEYVRWEIEVTRGKEDT